jgi:coenzyme F420-reducing hydrogenase beta subunit
MKKFVYENKPQSLCYGCRACEQVCSHKAISIYPNEEGFNYPHINPGKCTECGMCEQVCPTQDINRSKILHPKQTEVYAAWNKNIDERLQSTSGGIFYVIAKQFIKDGGIVYGASMNNSLLAFQKKVTTLNDLNLLRGSKYMQSDTNSSFKQVKHNLLDGEKVLYSGTPCQIAGLKLFLRKEYENLYTIDLVCHGTPSHSIFIKHLRYIESKEHSKINSFLFRDKTKSGWRTYISYKLDNGKIIRLQTGSDFYFHAFSSGYFNRLSCYQCEYSCSQRCGDITLSDFWGGENIIRQLYRQRKYGYNMIICSSQKGKELFTNIFNQIGSLKCDIAVAINGDVRLRCAEEKPALRNTIYKICKEKGYAYIAQAYCYQPTILQRITPKWLKNLRQEIKSFL